MSEYEDLTPFIIEQLDRVGVQVMEGMSTPTDLKAFCFKGHDDKTPSLSIRRSDGAFLCFGCGVKGKDWNSFAAYLKVDRLSEEDMPDPFLTLSHQMERQHKKAAKDAEEFSLPWDVDPWDRPYRGISAETWKRIGALRWYDDDPRIQAERILMPIRMKGILRGWVARRTDSAPPGEKLDMPYRNAPGMSSQDCLFPLDTVTAMQPDVVVLVEGPMDAMRLVNYNIPALAILGTRNYVADNRVHIQNTGATRVILAMDGDEAGDDVRWEISPSIREMFDLAHFVCPPGKDPGNMPRAYLDKLWRVTRKARPPLRQ
jgi:DNA primase